MDPIEKLLSELAPARAPGQLDAAMNRLFNRADRRARRFRATRALAAMAGVLGIGIAVGFQWGERSVLQTPVEITYLVSSPSVSSPGYFDFTDSTESALSSDVRLTVTVDPAFAESPADPNKDV